MLMNIDILSMKWKIFIPLREIEINKISLLTFYKGRSYGYYIYEYTATQY